MCIFPGIEMVNLFISPLHQGQNHLISMVVTGRSSPIPRFKGKKHQVILHSNNVSSVLHTTGSKKSWISYTTRRLINQRRRLTSKSLTSNHRLFLILVLSSMIFIFITFCTQFVFRDSLGQEISLLQTSLSSGPTKNLHSKLVRKNPKIFRRPTFGFVMRDFARRVLSRKISNSNILVIAPDATKAAKHYHVGDDRNHSIIVGQQVTNPYDSIDFRNPYSLGGTFLLYASVEGHSVHAIDAGSSISSQDSKYQQVTKESPSTLPWTRSLNEWWSSFNDASINKSDRWWSSSSQQPKWILATVIDAGFGNEDDVWKDSDRFLAESTCTYIVITIHARKVSNNNEQYFEFDGLRGVRALLERNYKVQIMSSSHYYTLEENDYKTADAYGPNRLFRSMVDVQNFLRWGADAAVRFEGLHPTTQMGSIFTAHLFATQGLDLAIPSSRVHLSSLSRVVLAHPPTQINLYKPLEFKPCRQAQGNDYLPLNISFQKWKGDSIIRVDLRIGNSTSKRKQSRIYHRKAPSIPGFSYLRADGNPLGREGPKPSDVSLWYDSHNIDFAEAACVGMADISRCTTQVIPQLKKNPDPIGLGNRGPRETKHGQNSPNLLLIMLDPMSRGHFLRTMPQTKSALEDLGFIHFEKYTAVGKNSGPNQAALYSGMPLASRDGIKKELKNGTWLWDRLGALGYKTLKAEDGCIENSNMIQSIRPNTTHGDALQKLFCFDFDRPNCIGPDLASTLLLQYSEQFINAYDEISPWAGLVHFIDSHEDTMVLSGTVDPQLSQFLIRLTVEEKKFENTVVILTSDHGLHYGPYFQSLAGRREATEPLLYIHIPASVRSRIDLDTINYNAGLWATPFDVHETILNFTSAASIRSTPSESSSGTNRQGFSLFDRLPKERMSCETTETIPNEYCEQFERYHDEAHQKCKRVATPPSPLSFYADIPLNHRSRPKLLCDGREDWPASKPDRFSDCVCATSHRLWYNCTEHPWGKNGISSKSHIEENFALMKCKHQESVVDTRIVRDERLVTRFSSSPFSEETADDGNRNVIPNSPTMNPPRRMKQNRTLAPNILFIEVDSASVAYADRHFPLTREFLRRHRMRRHDGLQDAVDCEEGICAADFSLFSVVGPNSIANQVPALSGCVVSRFHESCFGKKSPPTHGCVDEGMYMSSLDGSCKRCPLGTFLSDPLRDCSPDASTCCTNTFPDQNETRTCHDESLLEHGLQLFRRGPRRHNTWCPAGSSEDLSGPFLFDIAKAKGYVTFFGEELCYDDSLFVTQGNTFPLDADYELHKLYCRLNDNRDHVGDVIIGPRLCARQRTSHGKASNPAFDQITSLWNAYPDVPKFVFMNAVAAHDYSFSWRKMVSTAEAYDEQLAAFLTSMTSQDNFANTLIVLRADHGLQGGPTTVEYFTQVEHRDPWTHIILPQQLPGVSLDALFENQDRLATGFDLYRTLREMMSPDRRREKFTTSSSTTSSSSQTREPPIPDWSYNLLRSKIPDNRTCRDAKIPVDFCPCEGEGPDLPPTYGVCNPFDPYGDLYCVGGEEAILPDLLEI